MGVYDLLHCKQNPDGAYACGRTGALSFLYFVTFVIVTVSFVRLKLHSRTPLSLKLIIVGLGVLETFCGIVNYTFYSNVQLAFTQMWFKLLQYNLITYYFVRAATRLRGHEWAEWADRWVLQPILGFMCLAVSVLYIIAAFGFTTPSEGECADTAWILMSGSSFALAVVFLLCALFMTKKVQTTHMSQAIKSRQKFQLWLLVVANLVASCIHLGYDIYMRNSTDCAGLRKPTFTDAALFVVMRALSRLVPVLAVVAAYSVTKAEQRRTQAGTNMLPTLESFYEKPRRDSVPSPRAYGYSSGYMPPSYPSVYAQHALGDEDEREFQTM